MLDWNVLVTAADGRGKAALRALRPLGNFWPSEFADVLVGRVPDPEVFLGRLEKLLGSRPALAAAIRKAVPIDRTFDLSMADAPGHLEEVVKDYLDRVVNRRFRVQVARRGGPQPMDPGAMEDELEAVLRVEAARRGLPARVDRRDPDLTLVIETLGDVGGIGMVTRAGQARHGLVRAHPRAGVSARATARRRKRAPAA